MTRTLSFIVLSIATASCALAQTDPSRPQRGDGQPREGGPPRFREGFGGGEGNWLSMMARRMSRQLNLDEQQQQQYDRILANHEQQMAGGGEWSEKMRGLLEQMREARENNDDAKAEELRGQMQQLRDDPGNPMNAFIEEIKPILNDEQRGELEQMRERMGQGVGQGGPRGPRDFGADRDQAVNRLREELNLDDQQAARFDELAADMKTRADEQRQAFRNMRPLMQQMRAARESGDDAQVAKLEAQMAELRPEEGDPMDAFLDQLAGVLHADQKKVLDRYRNGGWARQADRNQPADDVRTLIRAAKRLELNDEQREQISEIERNAGRTNRDVRTSDREGQALLARTVRKQITDILTPEQTTEFERFLASQQRGRGAGGDDRRQRRPGGGERETPGEPEPAEEPQSTP
jgi:Spy/CpxP family protein refolding chaperone